jgi:Uma2 family endonuclease
MALMSANLEYPQKHLISAEEYLRMDEGGVFSPEARLELIEGEIIEMAPIKGPHMARVNKLTRLFIERLGDRAIVSVGNAVVIADRSVPQPDLAILAPREDEYASALPRPSDVLLVVEVSDTTLRFDLRAKVPLYARCGIRETWVVDVNERVIHVFREPGAGGYGTSRIARAGDRVACAALPEAAVEVGELFPA